MIATRTARYEKLSALLASFSDIELDERIGLGQVISVGVGGESGILDIDGVPVFTKRIPLSDREVANLGSTANLFDLPTFCQYGMGGPGFNAWRELAAKAAVRHAIIERSPCTHARKESTAVRGRSSPGRHSSKIGNVRSAHAAAQRASALWVAGSGFGPAFGLLVTAPCCHELDSL